MSQHFPLVISEVVDNYEEYLFTLIQFWKNLGFEDVWTHDGLTFYRLADILGIYPFQIVLGDVFGKSDVGFFFLHGKQFCHRTLGVAQFKFPFYQSLIYFYPILYCPAIHDLHGDLLVVLLITALGYFCDYIFAMYVLLEREQYLAGVDRFDEIVCDF